MLTTPCPNCHSDVIIEDGLSTNDLVSCINCGTELEIISLHPLAIKGLADDNEEMKDNTTSEEI